ncbi:hypothetical protein [uncultured Campylobacter sp.]|uniref:hypothetical protein n=1 Tax=uncultured Campylobacter sp. TaxID=218934 RepID=UPI00262DECBD|nr:hypothetical protein [uncultured Campylobacter sp.]
MKKIIFFALLLAGAAWACKEANPARIFIAANDEDQGGTLNRAEWEKAVAPKNIKLKFTAQDAAWTAKFDEPDADKNGELDVLELRGYELVDYVKAPCANWNDKVGYNAEK